MPTHSYAAASGEDRSARNQEGSRRRSDATEDNRSRHLFLCLHGGMSGMAPATPAAQMRYRMSVTSPDIDLWSYCP